MNSPSKLLKNKSHSKGRASQSSSNIFGERKVNSIVKYFENFQRGQQEGDTRGLPFNCEITKPIHFSSPVGPVIRGQPSDLASQP